MRKPLIISLTILLILCGAYIGYRLLQDTEDVGIANPASTNCIEKGGELIIEEEENGQVGYCVFNDGSKCEEWEFFREQCEKGNNK